MKLLLLVCCLISSSLVASANDSLESSSKRIITSKENYRFFEASSSSEDSNSTSSSEESFIPTSEVSADNNKTSSIQWNDSLDDFNNLIQTNNINKTRYVRDILDWVYIESKRHPNYMLYMSAPGNVYIYPKDNYAGGWNQKWTVETDITGTPHYRKFVNKQNYNVLYADDEGHAYGDSSKSKTEQYWEMIPVEDGYYYLKNRHNGRILDSGELQSCSASSTCCCGTAHAYSVYTGTDFQKWKIY